MAKSTPKAKQAKKKEPAHVVKVGRTQIPIYRLARHGYQFRYYVAGVARRLTRGTLDKAIAAAEHEATGIENGRVQAGDLSAADVQSFVHATEALGKLGDQAPPLHAAVEEYVGAKILLPAGMSVGEAVRLLLRIRPQAAPSRPVAAVLEELLASLADSHASALHVRGIRNDLGKWLATLPAGRTIDQVGTEDLRVYLRGLSDRQGRAVGARRRDNVRDELVTLFRFARSCRYLPEDRQTEAERIKRIKPVHEIRYFTPEQLSAFLVYVSDEWLPWMVLGAFGGLRTSEICGEPKEPGRARLRWTDIRWESASIIVPKSVAKKISRPRRVPLTANMQAWLLPWRQATGFVYPEVCAPSNETKRLSRATGLPWFKNGLRHSAATHLMAELGNAAEVAERLGTSVGRIKANYDAVPADIDPAAYYAISPGEKAEDGRKVLGMDGKPVAQQG